MLAAKKRGGAAAAILSKSATEAAEDAAKGIRGGKSNAMRRQYVRDQQAQKERNRLAEKQREMEQTWQQVPTPHTRPLGRAEHRSFRRRGRWGETG